jgi:hypothetical protein
MNEHKKIAWFFLLRGCLLEKNKNEEDKIKQQKQPVEWRFFMFFMLYAACRAFWIRLLNFLHKLFFLTELTNFTMLKDCFWGFQLFYWNLKWNKKYAENRKD